MDPPNPALVLKFISPLQPARELGLWEYLNTFLLSVVPQLPPLGVPAMSSPVKSALLTLKIQLPCPLQSPNLDPQFSEDSC